MSGGIKKCTSCKRRLPLELSFGIRRARPDGYRDECKDCINYRTKRLYRTKAPSDAPAHEAHLTIYPLREHMDQLVGNITKKGTHFIRASYLATREPVLIKLEVLDTTVVLTLIHCEDRNYDEWKMVGGETMAFSYHGLAIPGAVAMAVDTLCSLEIRAHLTEDLDV